MDINKIKAFSKELISQDYVSDIDIEKLKQVKKIIIVRTAIREQCVKAIKMIQDINPTINITLVTKDADIKFFQGSFPNISIVTYISDKEIRKQDIEAVINLSDFDAALVLYSNVYGNGYNNILELYSEYKQVYTYNVNYEFKQLNNIRLKMLNDEFLEQFIDWFNQYIEVRNQK